MSFDGWLRWNAIFIIRLCAISRERIRIEQPKYVKKKKSKKYRNHPDYRINTSLEVLCLDRRQFDPEMFFYRPNERRSDVMKIYFTLVKYNIKRYEFDVQ